jgi:hypothetical protein
MSYTLENNRLLEDLERVAKVRIQVAKHLEKIVDILKEAD